MSARAKINVGAVNYLNTKPLIYGLERFAPQISLLFDCPSRLADDLAHKRLDVALIPSIELFRNPDYRVVSDACIACRGPVLSVKLFVRTPIDQIRSLALDEGSRTSASLVRILLYERYGLTPRIEPLPIGAGLQDTQADAVLLIGDRAIHSPAGKFCAIWDLGDEWYRSKTLPFVFAMWIARKGVAVRGLENPLKKARDEGVAHVDQIAEAEAAQFGLTRPQCLDYLRSHLHFTLGPAEREGLKLFYKLSNQLGLAPSGWEITYCDSAKTSEKPVSVSR